MKSFAVGLMAATTICGTAFNPCKAVDFSGTYIAYTKHQKAHQNNGRVWNENNMGFGGEARFEELPIAVGVGCYANSYFKQTCYAGGRFDLLRTERFGDFGITAAYATGYDKKLVGGLSWTSKYLGILLAPQAPKVPNSSAFVTVIARFPIVGF